MLKRDEMKSLLAEKVAVVTFTKKNGELRKMKCTLKPDLLPPFDPNKEPSGRTPNDEVLPVWDLEANDGDGGWRAFRLDSVTEVTWSYPGSKEATDAVAS